MMIKDKALLVISERSLGKTEETSVGQMEKAACSVQLSTAFGSRSRRENPSMPNSQLLV